MSVEAASAVDADLARVSAASAQLATALSQENAGTVGQPTDVGSGQAAVQTAEANLQAAQAALQAAQAAQAAEIAQAGSAASTTGHSVTDPGGIVV